MINHKIKYSFLIIELVICSTIVSAQNEINVLASVGEGRITSEEFKHRFELILHFTIPGDYLNTLKQKFLYSLIAEKFWAFDAETKGYGSLDVVKYSMNNLEKLLIRNELYRSEIENKVKISHKEISKGLERLNKMLSVKVITSADSLDIFSKYKLPKAIGK